MSSPITIPSEAIPLRQDPDFDINLERGYMEGLDIEDLQDLVMDSVVPVADGCETEPDGYCQHGYISPLLWFGII